MKNLKKNSKLLEKVIKSLTLILPIPIYLFIMATIYNIHEDVNIQAQFDTISVIHVEDEHFITSTDENAKYEGVVEINDGKVGVFIHDNYIIKINKDYYGYKYNEKEDTWALEDIKKFEIRKKQSYNIPLVVFISIAGGLMAAGIISGKMQLYKTKPRLATFIALLTTTVILYIINTFVANILGIFIVITATWGTYSLEYLYFDNKDTGKKQEDKESELIRKLREGL